MTLSTLCRICFLLYLFSTVSFFLKLDDGASKLFQYLFFIIFVLLSYKYVPKCKQLTFYDRTFLFKLFLGVICFSIFPAYLYWQQSLSISFIAIMPFLMYSLYLILIHAKIEKEYIVKCINTIALLHISIMFLKFIFPSFPLGGILEDADRGNRLMIAGDMFKLFYFFELLYHYLSFRRRKDLLMLSLSFICILLPMTRQRIVAILFLGGIMLFKTLKLKWKLVWIPMTCIFCIIILKSNVGSGMVQMTNEQMTSENYHSRIREIGIAYYLVGFPDKGGNKLWGNGIPSYGRSKYGNDSKEFADDTKIYLIDIGLIGIYNYFGILGCIALLGIIFLFICGRCEDKYVYAKYVLGLLLLNSITSGVLLAPGEFLFIGISAYLLTPIKYGCFNNNSKLQYEKYYPKMY